MSTNHYALQPSCPHNSSAQHNVETWGRVKYHAGARKHSIEQLAQWAGGHKRDGGDGMPYIKYCIQRGWIS